MAASAGLPMHGMRLAPATVFFHLEPIGGSPSILGGAVVALFALGTLEIDYDPHETSPPLDLTLRAII